MPVRENPLVAGYYYHVYNRVPDGMRLFNSKENYRFCIKLLRRYALKCNVNIIAYCLMQNHYHMLAFQNKEGGLSKFISVLFNAYVQAFNKQHKRKGPLFADRFKNTPVEKEEYILHLCRYIHLNPVKANLVKHPEDWEFSDYRDWINGKALQNEQRRFIQDHFTDPEFYREFVADYQGEEELENALEKYYLES